MGYLVFFARAARGRGRSLAATLVYPSLFTEHRLDRDASANLDAMQSVRTPSLHYHSVSMRRAFPLVSAQQPRLMSGSCRCASSSVALPSTTAEESAAPKETVVEQRWGRWSAPHTGLAAKNSPAASLTPQAPNLQQKECPACREAAPQGVMPLPPSLMLMPQPCPSPSLA